MAKSVCIIGAGPSGLVAAKNLLHYSSPTDSFKVTVFDAQHAIGGLWPLSRSDTERQIHPQMVVNQSRHTIQFSDLAWQKDAPLLPEAWVIGQYLQRYMDRYLTSHDGFKLRLGTKVTKAAQKSNGDGSEAGWHVVLQSSNSDTEEQQSFDYLLVATGYFGQGIMPESLTNNASVPVIHSSQYRNLKKLLGTTSPPPKGRKILVVGGQMSGVEIAGTIASHLSSEANSPRDSEIPNISEYCVHHAIQRPFWVIPLFLSPEPSSPAPPFLPLDVTSYNRANRPLPLENKQGHASEDASLETNNLFENVLGTDQKMFSPLIHVDDQIKTKPPWLVVGDWYCDFVRSGLISLSQGKVESIQGTSAHLLDESGPIDDIAAVVLATGFDPSPCLGFLPDDVLQKIHYSPCHGSQVAALAFHATHHPEVPNLGFVGFYRSPYWGVMQMQARFLAELWSTTPKSAIFKDKLDKDTSIQRILDLRDDPRLSQFPMGDYAYIMQELAEALSMPIHPLTESDNATLLSHNNLPLSMLTPASYALPNEDGNDNEATKSLLSETASLIEEALTTPKFVSRAVFRSLLGTWRLERDLKSKLPSHPSGHFSGTAQFLLREQTPDGLQRAAAGEESDTSNASANAKTVDRESPTWEYLYIEDGDFKTESGLGFRATRRYIYRYDELTDKVSVWFAHPEDQKRVDYLFHEVEFEMPSEKSSNSDGWRAKSGHLCIDDYYDVKYRFKFKAVNLEEWTVGYTVNGPSKDYSIHGVYTR